MRAMKADMTTGLPFMKMHGLGNDFVVLDARRHGLGNSGGGGDGLSNSLVTAIADRHRGIGFDQLAVISDTGAGDAHLTFYNAD